jgi:hypothetical protein
VDAEWFADGYRQIALSAYRVNPVRLCEKVV